MTADPSDAFDPAPPFDEQSGRAIVYALLVECGEIAGFSAETEERTQADGTMGAAPVVRRLGRVVWSRVPIWAAADAPDDLGLATRYAIDVARLHAVELIVAEAMHPREWPTTLQRFRRSAGDPTLNPITRKKDRTNVKPQ